jgi:hypothetical protein
VGRVRGGVRLIGIVLFGSGFGFGRGVFFRKFANVMAFAGTPEDHGYNRDPGAGFAKIVSHKVGTLSAER